MTNKSSSSSSALEREVEQAVSGALKGVSKSRGGGGLMAKLFIAIGLIVVGAIGAIMLERAITPHANLSTSDIQEQIEEVSDLATAQLSYRGLVQYEEGSIRFINKKAFTMVYDAEVKAGVDLSKAQISVDGSTINVTLPEAEMQSIEIDPNSLQFYDEQRSLFNWQDREDTAEALKLAQENAQEKVDQTDLIAQAQSTAHDLVQNMLKPFTLQGLGYTVNVTDASGTTTHIAQTGDGTSTTTTTTTTDAGSSDSTAADASSTSTESTDSGTKSE